MANLIQNYPNLPQMAQNPFITGFVRLLLMITTPLTKESNHVLEPLEPSAFQFDWNTNAPLKDDFTTAKHSPLPQYTNLTSPSSSTESKTLELITSSKSRAQKSENPQLHQCALCGFTITDKEISVVEDKCFHHHCLRCSMCDSSFTFNDKCYVRDGALFCRTDHAKRYLKRCVKCELPLNSDDMIQKARDLIFHHACFVCFICGAKLNPGDYYTMSSQGHLYCHAHYNVVRTAVLCEEAGVALPTVVVPPVLQPQPVQPQPQEQPQREASTEAEASTDEDGTTTSHQRSKRMRTSFKHHQLRAMKTYFALNHNPDAKDLKQLAAKTNLTKRVLQVWFQNARAKYRRNLQESNGRGGSPLCVTAPLQAMDMNPPLSSSSSGHSNDGASYQLNTPPLSNEIYSPANTNYTHL